MSDKRLRLLERRVERLKQRAMTAEVLLDSTRRINWQVQDELEQRVRELEAAREAQARLMEVVSHELRTPMNGMLGASQLLLEQITDPEQRSLLQAMHDSTRSLARMVDHVLAHHDGLRQVGAVLEPTDLRGLVHELRVLHAHQAQLRGLDLGVHVSAELPLWTSADGERIRQVLTSLIDNALSVCRDGRVDLEVHWADDRARFVVRDTGPGRETDAPASAESLPRGRRAMGWGLGLAICRQVVNLLGGELGLESREEGGSAFSFTLPMHACEAPTRVPVSEGRLDGLRVLVVDDDEVNRLVAVKMLQSLGAETVEACDGLQALGLAEEVDVVLLDLAMPDMDGYACARRLREQGLKVAILAFTASSIPGTRQACLDAGMDGHVSKPVLRATLFNEIRRALKDRSGPGRRSRPGR